MFTFVVTASSSSVGMPGQAFVHLKLSFDKKDPVHLSLCAEDFYKMMAEMERVKNNIQILSAPHTWVTRSSSPAFASILIL